MNRKTVAALAVLCGALALTVSAGDAGAFGQGKKGMMGGKGGFGGGKMGGQGGGKDGGMGGPGGGDVEPPEGMSEETAAAFLAMKAQNGAMDARGLIETGLRPLYPEGLDCRELTSVFGARTRSDGSQRSRRYYAGRHGGADFPAQGVDIIAMADGEVVEKSPGGNIGGVKVVLRHAPEDTGLGVWTFTEYKHLREESPLDLGQRVKQGTPVGVAWNTGTTGSRAYGADGFHHLHLTAWYNGDGAFWETRMMLIPKDGRWLDPMAMLRGGPVDSAAAKALPDADKAFRFPYMTADGATHPAGAKVVWPFVCR